VNTAYVVLQGGALRREGERLVVLSRGQPPTTLQTQGLEQLVIVGNPTLSCEAIDLLASQNIDTVLLTTNGRYRARIARSPAGNVRLRMAQYALVGDGARCLPAARALVLAKIGNQRAFLLRVARKRTEPRLDVATRAMSAAATGAGLADSLDELRGFEGAAAAAYFKAFGAALLDDRFHFDSRKRRPPPDPVNALLSLGYTLLLRRMESAAAIVGLDPFLGLLHTPEAGRPSLALDLIEPYRTPMVDALVVAAINKGAIRPDHFEDAGAGEPVVVTREGTRAFVSLFAKRLEREVLDPATGKRLPWRALFVEECRRLARYVLDGALPRPYLAH
jgi:CRISPR-associated protein Cas1